MLLRGDVSRAEDVVAALGVIASGAPPLRGIFHAAGVLDDRALLQQDWGSFERVMASKVAGAWNLHSLTDGLPIEHFVLFSSVMAVLGMPGQANYAAANAYLDTLAHLRHAQGLPATSINWGVWGDVGLVTKGNRGDLLTRRGLRPMDPEDGVAALEHVLNLRYTQATVLTIDWKAYLQQIPHGHETALLAELSGVLPAEADQTRDDIVRQLDGATPQERLELLQEHIRGHVAAVLRFKSEQRIGLQQGFFQLGMDSLTSMELRNRLQLSLGRVLPPTLAFDYPTIAVLARFLADTLAAESPRATAPNAETPAAEPAIDLDTVSRDELRQLLDTELESIEEELFG
jgi:acyl carrier protein